MSRVNDATSRKVEPHVCQLVAGHVRRFIACRVNVLRWFMSFNEPIGSRSLNVSANKNKKQPQAHFCDFEGRWPPGGGS